MVRVVALIAFLALMVALADSKPSGDSCRYWCIRNTSKRQRYCCDKGQFPEVRPTNNRGRCPIDRPCPDDTPYGASPRLCPHDGHCSYNEKCCYDSCLKHHACKLASG